MNQNEVNSSNLVKSDDVGEKSGEAEGLTQSERLDIIESIGINHNLCMDYVSLYFDSLKGEGWTSTESEIDSLIRVKIYWFYSNNTDILGEEEFDIVENVGDLEGPIEKLSQEANLILEDINDAVEDYIEGDINYNEIRAILTDLKEEASELPSDGESIIVGATASVGYHSFDYWANGTGDYSIYDVGLSDNQKEVGKADLSGAFWGGLGGSIGGPPGIIISGSFTAAYESTKKAFEVTQGWDLWWLP